MRKVRDTLAPRREVDYRLLEQTGELPVPTSATVEPTLDGIGAVHDAIRGEGAYEPIVANIRRALAMHRVYVSFVMMESNIHQIPEFVQTVTGFGVREIGFQHEIYCLPGDVEATRRQFGWTPADVIMMTVKEKDWTKASIQRLYQQLAVLPDLERRHGFAAAFEPPLSAETYPALYDGTIRSATRLFCRELTNLYIDPAGNLVHCGFLRRKFGNVLDQPVEAIWNSTPLREFRKRLLDGNLAPVCRRCCKLSLWPDATASHLSPSAEALGASSPATKLLMLERGPQVVSAASLDGEDREPQTARA